MSSASRTFNLDLNDLTSGTLVLGDSFGFYDLSLTETRKALFSDLNGILDHDALFGFVAMEHIDHSSVSITGGTGLSGGGTIDATRTINLNLHGLSIDSPSLSDEFPLRKEAV